MGARRHDSRDGVIDPNIPMRQRRSAPQNEQTKEYLLTYSKTTNKHAKTVTHIVNLKQAAGIGIGYWGSWTHELTE